MLKYLCFIILGIVLFLLWNHINRFSIGNQYSLEPDPNLILLDLFNKVVNREEVCSRDFAECSTIMLGVGGDCQINTIVGLYDAIKIPFEQADIDYINSVGRNLPRPNTLPYIYDYLTNRLSMKSLLFRNNLNPQVFLTRTSRDGQLSLDFDREQSNSFLTFAADKLYPIYLAATLKNNKFTKTDGAGLTKELMYGHALLMYKTDFNGLRSFKDSIPMMDIGDQDLRTIILDDLNASVELLDSASPNIKTNGCVCLMIDLCQKKFYAVTELDFPSTVAVYNNLYDDAGIIHEANHIYIDQYYTLWKMKINIKYNIQYGTVSFNTTDESLNQLDLGQFSQPLTEVQRNWINDPLFRHIFQVFSYVPSNKNPPYLGEYDSQKVQLKPRTDFYGILDTICLDDTEDERCNSDGLVCKENTQPNPDSAERYDMCVERGTEGTPCIRNTSDLYMWTFDEPEYWQCSEPQLYCKKDVLLDGSKINMCVERGTEGATCRDELGNGCNPGLDCLIDYNSRDRNLCVNSRDIVLNSIPKIVFKEQDGVLIQINQSGLIYAYNPGFHKDPHMPYRYYLPSLNQLKQGIIYLGDYQKQSTGMSKRWQQRSFFLEWDNSRCYIMYCEPINRPTGSTGIQAFVTEGNIVLDIKDRLEIIHLSEHFPNFFQLGKNDATETDLYVTILLNDTRGNASKGITYLEISTSSRIDDLTPEYHLVQALNYVEVLLGLEQQKQQEEQQGLCSAIVAGVASQRFGDL